MADQPILLVEDDLDDANLLKRAMSVAGIKRPLLVITHAEEAIRYLDGKGQYADRDRHPLPSLVLIDLKLEGLPGHEVIAWLRARRQFDAVKIIVLSGLDHEAHRSEAYRLGANSFLVKTPKFEELVEKVKNIAAFWPGVR